MATTTKKSTTRKKPTAKTSSAKTTKKTTSKKVVKAPAKVAAKPAVKSESTSAPAKKTPGAPLTKMQKLFRWNIVLAALHAIQAAAIIILSKPDLGVQSITTNHLTLDTLASTAERPVLVSATRHLFDVNLSWFIAAFFVIF